MKKLWVILAIAEAVITGLAIASRNPMAATGWLVACILSVVIEDIVKEEEEG